MGERAIHDVKELLSTELHTGQFRVLLQDSDVRRTETFLAQPHPEQTEWYRWPSVAGLGLAINVDGMQRSFGRYRGWLVFSRQGSCQRRFVQMKRSRVRDRDDSARSGQFE
jgi:hypothetical protein